MFSTETFALRKQFNEMRREHSAMESLVKKMEKMQSGFEREIGRVKISLKIGEVERLYEQLDVQMPRKIRVALFLIMQFESNEFNMDETVYKE